MLLDLVLEIRKVVSVVIIVLVVILGRCGGDGGLGVMTTGGEEYRRQGNKGLRE